MVRLAPPPLPPAPAPPVSPIPSWSTAPAGVLADAPLRTPVPSLVAPVPPLPAVSECSCPERSAPSVGEGGGGQWSQRSAGVPTTALWAVATLPRREFMQLEVSNT
eukprot:scaffold87891_cov23-Tisochrysis_lutea.AAC.4